MLGELDPEDMEFINYLMEQMPVGFLYMSYQDFQTKKKLVNNLKGKITNSDVNRLKLKLKLGEFNNFMKGKQ